MEKIEQASSIEQLGEMVVELATVSLKQYQQLTTQAWGLIAGSKSPDTEQLAKDFTTYVGTMVRDMGNALSVFQKAMELAQPDQAPPAPSPGTSP